MARVTVEDALENVENRFELVMLAARRARLLADGVKKPKVDIDNDKPTVIALREIAEGLVSKEIMDSERAQEELAEELAREGIELPPQDL